MLIIGIDPGISGAICFLKNGKVVVQGEHDDLLKTSKSYSNYING